MAKLYQWAAFALVGLTATGCVTQRQYRTVKLERDQARQEAMEAKANASQFRLDAEFYRQQLQAMGPLDGRLDDLSARLDAINTRYFHAIDVGGEPLPQELASELTSFAEQHKDVLEFDANRRMVKFKTDLTFGKGSADLSPKGKEALAKLAQILNKDGCKGFEIMVAGHTDNVRVAKPSTIQAGHKDNWYLSSHRAIVVGQELRKHKVDGERLAMVGYADQRPIAPNSNEAGRSQNRRVEVLILPTQVKAAATTSQQPTQTAEAGKTPSTQPSLGYNDESIWGDSDAQVELDTRPVLNK